MIAKLRERYPLPEWASAAEVSDATGAVSRRRCDFFAMNCYPSKGLAIHGHEVKVSRSDWLREIQDPEKAATFERRCHYWWIVASAKVVEPDELPAGWGLMVVGKTLRVKKAATRRDAEPLGNDFTASILRAIQSQSSSESSVKAIEQAAYSRGYKCGKADGARYSESDVRTAQAMGARLQKSIDAFEEESGIKIEAYQGRSLGKAVAALKPFMDRDYAPAKKLAQAESAAAAALAGIKAMRTAVDEIATTPKPQP